MVREAERRAGNFKQQDLANLYRRTSLMDNLLPDFLKHGFCDEKHADYVEHLASFREQLSLDVAREKKQHVSLIDVLDKRKVDHERYIYVANEEVCERNKESVKLIMDKVKMVQMEPQGGSLAQEQEQEQEEEKEQETIPRADDQPVILSDLAFARTNEEQQPWKVEVLGDRSTWDKRDKAGRIVEVEKERLEAKTVAGSAGGVGDSERGEQRGPRV